MKPQPDMSEHIANLNKITQPYVKSLKREEREEAKKVAVPAFGGVSSWRCALCGRNRPLEIHHIFPIEEGGKSNKENLIPLCKGERKLSGTLKKIPVSWDMSFLGALNKKRINPIYIGCHDLAQHGLISRDKIRDVRKNMKQWGNYSKIRDKALNTPLKQLNTEYRPAPNRERQLKELRSQLKRADDTQWFSLKCSLINILRRLFSRSSLKEAMKHCTELQKFLSGSGKIDKLPKDLLSTFYYERAYLSMLRASPNLNEAISFFKKSGDYASKYLSGAKNIDEINGKAKWAMSNAEAVYAEILTARNLSDTEYKRLFKEQEKYMNTLEQCERQCRQLLSKISDKGLPDRVKKWLWNIQCHRAKLQAKAGKGKADEAMKSLKRARKSRDGLDITTGWTQFQAVHLNVTEGIVEAHRGNYERALQPLAFALDTMAYTGAKGERPEGYKDVANCAAWVLKEEFERIANKMVDGRSGLWTS